MSTLLPSHWPEFSHRTLASQRNGEGRGAGSQESMAKDGEPAREGLREWSDQLDSCWGTASSSLQPHLNLTVDGRKLIVFPTLPPLVFPLLSVSMLLAGNNIKLSHQALRSEAFIAAVFDT